MSHTRKEILHWANETVQRIFHGGNEQMETKEYSYTNGMDKNVFVGRIIRDAWKFLYGNKKELSIRIEKF